MRFPVADSRATEKKTENTQKVNRQMYNCIHQFKRMRFQDYYWSYRCIYTMQTIQLSFLQFAISFRTLCSLTTWKLEELSFDAFADKSLGQFCTLCCFPASVNAFYHNKSSPSNMFCHCFICTNKRTQSTHSENTPNNLIMLHMS